MLYYHKNDVLIASSAFIVPAGTTKAKLHTLQRQAVRKLLAKYQNDALFIERHPYQLLGKKRRFVSFSHSGNKVALIISPAPCGIDIETRPIGCHVAERFFHPNELDYIASFANNEKSTVIKQLWQIKECMVKLQNTTLSQLISQDMTEYDKAITGSVRQWVDCPSADGKCYLLWQDHQTIAIQKTDT